MPATSDAPNFGDHLSRAARPTPQADEAGKTSGAASAAETGEISPDLAGIVDEPVMIAAGSQAVFPCDEANTHELQLLEGDRAESAGDEESEREPTAEELSLVVTLTPTPPAETLVQVDMLTLGEAAQALAAESSEEIAPAAKKPAAKPRGASAVPGTVPPQAPIKRANPIALPPTNVTATEPLSEAKVSEAAVEAAKVASVVVAVEPEVVSEVIATAVNAPVDENQDSAAEKRTPAVRADRAARASRSGEGQEQANSESAAADALPQTEAEPAKPSIDRVIEPTNARDRPRPQIQDTGSPTTIAPQLIAAAAAVEKLSSVAATSSRGEEKSARSTRSAVEANAPATPATPPSRLASTPVEATPPTPLRDGNGAMTQIGSTLGRRSSVAATNGGEVDRVRFVQRVARAMQTSVDRGGEVTLRLSPPELGAMRLEVAIREGVMSAHIETETPAARSVLMDNLPALRDRLAEQNVRIEKFEVDVRGSDNGALPDRTADQANSSRQEQSGRGNRKRTDSLTEITGPTTVSPRSSRDGQLNVVV